MIHKIISDEVRLASVTILSTGRMSYCSESLPVILCIMCHNFSCHTVPCAGL